MAIFDNARNVALLGALTACASSPPSKDDITEPSSPAQQAGLSFSASSQIVSAYRLSNTGRKVDEEGVQSSISCFGDVDDRNSMKFTLWNHQPINSNPRAFQEIDANASFTHELSPHSTFTLSSQNFFFPEDKIPTIHRVAANLTDEKAIGDISLSIDFGWSYSGFHNSDAALTLSRPIQLGNSFGADFSITPSSSVGFVLNGADFYSQSGLASEKLGLSIEAITNRRFSFNAGVDYVNGEMPDVKDGVVFRIGGVFNF